ncbi:hypothetical protein AB0D86_49420 [Streptomyces sp. NPDC048324]
MTANSYPDDGLGEVFLIRYDDAPSEDGRHCPDCRTDLARQV